MNINSVDCTIPNLPNRVDVDGVGTELDINDAAPCIPVQGAGYIGYDSNNPT